jgi:hypothetical protein
MKLLAGKFFLTSEGKRYASVITKMRFSGERGHRFRRLCQGAVYLIGRNTWLGLKDG